MGHDALWLSLPFENLKGQGETRWEWWPPGGGHISNTFKGQGVSPYYSMVDLKIFLCYNSIRSDIQFVYVMIRPSIIAIPYLILISHLYQGEGLSLDEALEKIRSIVNEP